MSCCGAVVARSGKRCGEEARVVPTEGHGIPHGIQTCRGGFMRARMTERRNTMQEGWVKREVV